MKAVRVVVLVGLLVALSALPASAGKGNLSPTGPHYNLNIIGVPKGKTATMDDTSGHRIFVPLEGTAKIWLKEGTPYAVLDANGTDTDGASFQLPNPDPENDGVTRYSVWARALGKPGGSADMTTCATDPDTGEELCSVVVLELTRSKGQSKFDNVSRELLYIYVDLDGDGTAERYNLFNSALQDYFWQYDNDGLKIVQLRFYEMPTDVTGEETATASADLFDLVTAAANYGKKGNVAGDVNADGVVDIFDLVLLSNRLR